MSAARTAATNTVVATDAELVAAVRRGDDLAFEELYRRYHPRIASFVRRFVRDGGRCEDVAQDAFMSALRRLRQSDSEINFKPWIFEIARNAAIDQYRRTSRAQEVSIDVDGGVAYADVARVPRPQGPDSSMLDKERLENLQGALDELSGTHHRIIVMRELEGLSYREIGERMELTPAAVESTLFRARRKLEHEYEQLDGGHRCQAMGTTIARLAEGFKSDRDRKRLDRHARRCSHCRRRARQLGVEPILHRQSVAARAAALIPLPAFARRRLTADGAQSATAGAQQASAPLGAVAGPTFEMGATMAAKAAAVIATVALVGGGGATLGGVGPLAIGGKGASAVEKQQRKGAASGKATGAGSSSSPRSRSGARERRSAGAGKGQDRRSQKPAERRSSGSSSTPSKDGSRAVPGVPGLPGLPAVPRSDSSPPAPPEAPAPPPEQPPVTAPAVPDPVAAPQLAAPAAPTIDASAADAVGAAVTGLG